MTTPADTGAAGRRPVGRPRRLDDQAERRRLLEAGYRAVRDQGDEVTIAAILDLAGVSTRAFYRQFESKDALLSAMYRQDAEWAARHLAKRLDQAPSARARVETWIDEIFDMVTVPARAERVAVMGSILTSRTEILEAEAVRARRSLLGPLRRAIAEGAATGELTSSAPDADADLVAALTVHAAGLGRPALTTTAHDRVQVTAFVLRALTAGTG